MRLNCIAAAIAACVSLTACEGSVTGQVKRVEAPMGVTTEYTIGGTITFGGSSRRLTDGSLDVSNFAVDITGQNTVVLDGWGVGIIVISQGGTPIASTEFNYVVMNSMAVAADPAAVNAWLAGYPTADGFDVKLPQIDTVDVTEGTAALTAETVWGGDVVATSTTYWPSGGGGGCSGGGDGGVLYPEMPIVDPGDPGVCP